MPCTYWILIGPREAAGSRIHGYRIHDFLLRRGRRSEILFEPFHWLPDPPITAQDARELPIFGRGDVVIFQKVSGPATRSLLTHLKSLGVATVYVDCDLPLKIQEARLASITICSSEYLASLYMEQGGVTVRYIPDAYECSIAPREKRSPRRRLRCVWFGSGTSARWKEINLLKQSVFENLTHSILLTVSDHPEADVRWNPRTAWKHIQTCDVAVIPASDSPEAFAKSSNRAIQAMALGLPVVAFPIPAYLEVIRDGRNGFLCTTPEDWHSALTKLKNPSRREWMSARAYRYARRYFAMDRIGPIWDQLLQGLSNSSSKKAETPQVEVLRVGI